VRTQVWSTDIVRFFCYTQPEFCACCDIHCVSNPIKVSYPTLKKLMIPYSFPGTTSSVWPLGNKYYNFENQICLPRTSRTTKELLSNMAMRMCSCTFVSNCRLRKTTYDHLVCTYDRSMKTVLRQFQYDSILASLYLPDAKGTVCCCSIWFGIVCFSSMYKTSETWERMSATRASNSWICSIVINKRLK
jgi:hypothetical protein